MTPEQQLRHAALDLSVRKGGPNIVTQAQEFLGFLKGGEGLEPKTKKGK